MLQLLIVSGINMFGDSWACCEVACGGSVCLTWQEVPLANGDHPLCIRQEVNHQSVICLHKPTSQDPPN